VYVTNSPAQKATYAEGALTLQRTLLGEEVFGGSGTVFASTERWGGTACVEACGFFGGGAPFDPTKVNAVSGALRLSGEACVRIDTGPNRTIDLVCDTEGTLHGPARGSSAPTQYVFSLKRLFVPDGNPP